VSVPEHEDLTAKQHEELQAELAELEARRPGIVQAIKVAREFGDLSENFEYHAAKNEQGLLEARIRTLRHRLDNSKIVEAATGDTVAVGSHVEIEDPTGKKLTVEISNLTKPGAVSPTAPLGAALMGARAGDEVEVVAPRGAWTAKVVAIRPA
jgi:transcription elongation factor GreA